MTEPFQWSVETARGICCGTLHGVPIAIKDNLEVAGMPTRVGSDMTDATPALPCGIWRAGLPVGMQAVAAHGREDRLFAFGRLFQGHSDWHALRAPLTSMGRR
jgi:Asp-tRNA(Asn)/Glu-tRNA(Gln) amidotransferase A subunit family amidase